MSKRFTAARFPIVLDQSARRIELRPLAKPDASALAALQLDNMQHLQPSLTWAQSIPTITTSEQFVDNAVAANASCEQVHLAIEVDSRDVSALRR